MIVTLRNAGSGVTKGKLGGLTASRPYREMETFNDNQHARSRGAFIDQLVRNSMAEVAGLGTESSSDAVEAQRAVARRAYVTMGFPPIESRPVGPSC